MKRESLLRDLRKQARKSGVEFEVIKGRGKGAHYRVRYGTRWTTVKSGELTPTYVSLIRKQLGA